MVTAEEYGKVISYAIKLIQKDSGGILDNDLLCQLQNHLEKKIKEYDPSRCRLSTFLTKIAVWYLSSCHRERRRYEVRSIKYARKYRKYEVKKQNEPSFFLEDVLSKLEGIEREVIDLRYNEDLTFEKIAEKLGYSRQFIQLIHTKIIKKLRQDFERDLIYD